MNLSCKLTHTVLLELEVRGEDITPLLLSVGLPEEILRDPSCWMHANEMESFLDFVHRHNWQTQEENFLQKIARSAPRHRSWGLLDSVLRMMPRPQEIWAQPSRLLSHFISPEPPLEKIIREEAGTSFEVPISSEQFPCTTEFLKSSFEVLPVFIGRTEAVCTWTGTRVQVQWESKQNSMLESFEQDRQLSPDLLREIVGSLEKNQSELQKKNAELQARNEQLLKVTQELEAKVREANVLELTVQSPLKSYDFIEASSAEILRQNFAKLTDYWVRSQQLITLLIGQDRMNPAVKEAMRRVDWDRVKTQFHKTAEESFLILEKSKQQNVFSNSDKETSNV